MKLRKIEDKCEAVSLLDHHVKATPDDPIAEKFLHHGMIDGILDSVGRGYYMVEMINTRSPGILVCCFEIFVVE